MFTTYETETDPNPSRLHATRIRYKSGEAECKHILLCGVNDETDQVIPSETDIDDVVQVNNVFINVSKGEVAKTEDLKKAFGKADREAIVREVTFTQIAFASISLSPFADSSTRRDSDWGQRARARTCHLVERNRHLDLREMRRSRNTASYSSRDD
jgi:hypothetical protein